ncbi:hypothetical protein ACG33_12120 [Steroidobacter denitrificans]|uniref:Zinc finger/thioredoxin putative domain-containing protein n=1 Tax=Steroidobacter denitrificans TaxID=465721 RepID=A0A127FDK5_STEDE|nr:DUF3426 domain-containing protein [Steroidobacter denitrificans]AMN47830.1 hypothetical protein ACG33_12120 [Steroidobacter denitrificans]
MLTQCPQCRTTFRITREILRIADGQVRCGRCQTQFDALERLFEEQDDLDIPPGRLLRESGTPAPQEPDTPSFFRPSVASSPEALNDAAGSGADEVMDDVMDDAWADILSGGTDGALDNVLTDTWNDASRDPPDDASSDIRATDFEPEPIYEIEVDASHEEITLEGRRIEISGTYQVMDDTGRGRLEVREESFQEEWAEIDEPEPDAVESPSWPASDAAPAADATPAAEEDEDLLPAPRPRRSALRWKILFLPLILVLAAQVIHANRAVLARHPRLGPPLTGIYRLLSLDLQPEWDLHAYEVRQWGIVSDPATPGMLRVRASIRNLAGFPQPYPLLKLVLEDRWGEQVRARNFEPAEYLDPGIAPDRLLAPAQTANATIVIVDPGPDAEGFHFDVCLRGSAGPVCAADLPGR